MSESGATSESSLSRDPREWKSGLYRGTVEHARYQPRGHRFRVSLHYLYLDLEELSQVFRRRWLWSVERSNLVSFRRKDYFGDRTEDLATAVRNRVSKEIGRPVTGPVRILTHLRSFGFVFNPVSFYYVFAEDGETLEAVLAEITNTPWGERHAYVIDVRHAQERRAPRKMGSRAGHSVEHLHHQRFDKEFHVSPFFEMEHRYDWGFSAPNSDLLIWMQNFHEGRKVFEARLDLERQPLTGAALARVLLRQPAISAFGWLAIYWQAARLWWKRIPFHPHPAKRPDDCGGVSEATLPGEESGPLVSEVLSPSDSGVIR